MLAVFSEKDSTVGLVVAYHGFGEVECRREGAVGGFRELSNAEAACADHLSKHSVVFGVNGWVVEEITRRVGVLFLDYLCG